MNVSLPAGLRPLWAQVRGNPRLQAGLALIALLVAGWVFLVLGDLRAARLEQRQQALQRYVQVRQLVGQEVWLQRADAANRLADALAAEIPPAQSPGLAQAAFQDWLKKIVDSEGEQIRLIVQAPAPVEDQDGLVQVTAEISGAMEPHRVWQMIHRIESSVSLVTIPILSVRTDGTNRRFSLTVEGFYRLPAAAEPGEPKP